MSTLTIYKVQPHKPWWRRKWQAEWECSYWCPRAYSRSAVERKAHRWMSRGDEWAIRNARRRQWFRTYVTARRDEFYRSVRLSGELKGAWRG